MREAVSKGLLQLTPADEAFDGRTVELDGRNLVEFRLLLAISGWSSTRACATP